MKIFAEAAFIFFAAYYFICTAYYLTLGLVGVFEQRRRAREDERENYALLSVSTFTYPVSVVVPAHNEERLVVDAVRSALNSDYPQLEVVVVNDGSDDGTMRVLTEAFALEPADNPYRDHFRSGHITGMYRSVSDPRLTVLSKQKGFKKAGAINAALNLVRYKYVCVMDGDTILEPDGLLKVMAHIQKDPERILGAGSCLGLSNNFEIRAGRIVGKTPAKPIVAHQTLEYIRAFIGSRLAWSSWGSLPIISGGFGVWKRDTLLRMGGFDPTLSSEDLDITFHAQEYASTRGRKDGKILMLPFAVAWTRGPETPLQLMRQRNRWQRVELEATWKYRRMFFNPRYRFFGFLTLPYFAAYETLGVVFEIASYILTLAGLLRGYFPTNFFFAFSVLIILSHLLQTLIPLYAFQSSQRLFRKKELAYLIGLTFTELFWYRWIVLFGRAWGVFDYCRGIRSHAPMDRSS